MTINTHQEMIKMPPSYYNPHFQEKPTSVAIEGYFNRTTNYYSWGVHNNVVSLGDFDLYFTYNIPIAFQDGQGKLYITRNENKCCGVGRALNTLSRDKSVRISWNNFYNNLLARLKMPIIR